MQVVIEGEDINPDVLTAICDEGIHVVYVDRTDPRIMERLPRRADHAYVVRVYDALLTDDLLGLVLDRIAALAHLIGHERQQANPDRGKVRDALLRTERDLARVRQTIEGLWAGEERKKALASPTVRIQ